MHYQPTTKLVLHCIPLYAARFLVCFDVMGGACCTRIWSQLHIKLVQPKLNNLSLNLLLLLNFASAPKLFNIHADQLSWMLEQQQVTLVIHHLDNFLTMSPTVLPYMFQ